MTTKASPLLDLRGAFPILSREIDGRRLVYLDSAASAQKPEAVLEAMDRFYRRSYSNVHRGVYTLAQEATDLFEGARTRIAEFVGGEAQTTIFTRNATEAINLVASAWGRDNVGAGDVVLVTEMEHHSNLVPWQLLCQEVGATLRYLEVDADGRLSLDQLDAELVRGDVKVVAFAHISNVLGTINPVAEIAARARAAGALSVVDGCQGVPQMPVDIPHLGVDFYVWTGHKAVGPTGIGVLHGRAETLTAMRPWLGGGHMISRVDRETSEWTDLPWKFEAGTDVIAEAVGLGAGVDYLPGLGMGRGRAPQRGPPPPPPDRPRAIDGGAPLRPPRGRGRGGGLSVAL